MFSRRTLLAGASAGLALSAMPLAAPRLARAAAPFQQPKLPFAEDALAPSISAQTVNLHYGKHHAAYFKALNDLVPNRPYADMTLEEVVKASAQKDDDRKIFNNAGQAWNHIFYWEQFKTGGAKAPQGTLLQAIERDFGGLDDFKTKFTAAAGDVFGSGWAWLVHDNGKLTLSGTPGGDSPFARGKTPLLGIDVWEHAYYLDYQNRRPEHVKAVLDNIVNWDVVAERMA
ncbi:superoxide dismutase [Terrihabitans sp. B22-R8]|uniref:superoxide dismutase n=1 Tax=Terrihabitans sp. B22-R8 TaxID=3425128 RepID=UPI00403CE7C2